MVAASDVSSFSCSDREAGQVEMASDMKTDMVILPMISPYGVDLRGPGKR
jgi:hypothetical protein